MAAEALKNPIAQVALVGLAAAALWAAIPEVYADGHAGWVCTHGYWKGMGCPSGC